MALVIRLSCPSVLRSQSCRAVSCAFGPVATADLGKRHGAFGSRGILQIGSLPIQAAGLFTVLEGVVGSGSHMCVIYAMQTACVQWSAAL